MVLYLRWKFLLNAKVTVVRQPEPDVELKLCGGQPWNALFVGSLIRDSINGIQYGTNPYLISCLMIVQVHSKIDQSMKLLFCDRNTGRAESSTDLERSEQQDANKQATGKFRRRSNSSSRHTNGK